MTSDEGMRTEEAMPSCRWDVLGSSDLVLSCRKKDSVAVLSFKVLLAEPNALTGSWGWRITGSIPRESSMLAVIAALMAYKVGLRR